MINQPQSAPQAPAENGFQVPEFLRIKDPDAGIAGTNFGKFATPSKDLSFGSKRMLLMIADPPNEEWQRVQVIAIKNQNGEPKYKTPSQIELRQVRSIFWIKDKIVMDIIPVDFNGDHTPQLVSLWCHVGMYPVPEEQLIQSFQAGDQKDA